MKHKRKRISLGYSYYDLMGLELMGKDGSYSPTRVPRLKASKAQWKRFYKRFPWLKGKKYLFKNPAGPSSGQMLKLKKI